MSKYFVDKDQRGIVRGGHFDDMGGMLVGSKAQMICDKLNNHEKLEAEVATLKALMSEALSNMEYYPASLGEYWLVQNRDIEAMQTAL